MYLGAAGAATLSSLNDDVESKQNNTWIVNWYNTSTYNYFIVHIIISANIRLLSETHTPNWLSHSLIKKFVAFVVVF